MHACLISSQCKEEDLHRIRPSHYKASGQKGSRETWAPPLPLRGLWPMNQFLEWARRYAFSVGGARGKLLCWSEAWGDSFGGNLPQLWAQSACPRHTMRLGLLFTLTPSPLLVHQLACLYPVGAPVTREPGPGQPSQFHCHPGPQPRLFQWGLERGPPSKPFLPWGLPPGPRVPCRPPKILGIS